jgi:hypothetical protein
MEQNPSWEATSSWSGNEIPRDLWNWMFRYRIHKSRLLNAVVSHMKPFHTFPLYFVKITV